MRTNCRSVAIAATLDVAGVIVFVAVGRRNHNEGTALDGVMTVAAPFLIALAIGWLVSRAWRQPMNLRTGVIIWASTIVFGLLLRNLAFDRGIATSFIIVATLFLGAVLLGWRAIFRLVK
ncbi:MAG: DUF3054 domain-containing protein [Ilumatobacteraceae bacterium]